MAKEEKELVDLDKALTYFYKNREWIPRAEIEKRIFDNEEGVVVDQIIHKLIKDGYVIPENRNDRGYGHKHEWDNQQLCYKITLDGIIVAKNDGYRQLKEDKVRQNALLEKRLNGTEKRELLLWIWTCVLALTEIVRLVLELNKHHC